MAGEWQNLRRPVTFHTFVHYSWIAMSKWISFVCFRLKEKEKLGI